MSITTDDINVVAIDDARFEQLLTRLTSEQLRTVTWLLLELRDTTASRRIYDECCLMLQHVAGVTLAPSIAD